MGSNFAWVRAHWRYVAVAVLVVVSYGAGRFSAPTKVETKTETKTVYQDRVVTVQSKDTSEAKIVYRDRTVIKRVDGTVVQRDVVRTEQDKDVKRVTEKAEVTTKVTDAVATKVVERAPPSWSINALGGINVKNPSEVVFGAQVSKRILGPISAGVWGLSSGVGGVSLGVTF